jgi:glycerate 2-kinase
MAAGVQRGSGPRNYGPPLDPRGARRLLQRLYGAALSGVDPEAAVVRALVSGEVRRALAGCRRVGIFAVGKAASAMARGARERLLPRGPALVVLPRGSSSRGLSGAHVLFAAHPRPDAGSVRAARRALRFFEGFRPDDAIVCLISGGASSLLALPRPGVTLAQKRRAVDALSRSGAPIQALNRLRISLSAVKGGRLGRATAARLITLVLSDVPGDRAELVGSGPTVRGRAGDVVRVVGTNAGGIRAAAREARRLGWRVVLAPAGLSGEAQSAGRRLARVARGLRGGTLLLAGGETVVVLESTRRRGGRSLELALSVALELDGEPGALWLAAGSDGRDGSSTAAGAFADSTTIARARRLGLDAHSTLRLHDTHSFFARLGDLWITGSTGTNVGDWVFLLRD